MNVVRSLFVFNPVDLDSDIPGGVQLCSREFLACVEAASDSVSLYKVETRHLLGARILRCVGAAAYSSYVASDYAAGLAKAIRSEDVSHVFINKSELVRFAAVIGGLRLPVRTILMSHGNQSGDDLGDIVEAGQEGIGQFSDGLALGLNLIVESQHRRHWVDGVCVMSDEERILEEWLGARNTCVLPRLLTSSPVDWKPVSGRLGYSGTLTHPPNRRALQLTFDELGARGLKNVEVRLVGRPESQGKAFASSYPFVRYLGPLSELELRAEAATWSAYLNPLFGLARGASMKLGAGLALGLPVISTNFGARGYDCGDASLPITGNSSHSFVDAVLQIVSTPQAMEAAAESCRRAVASAPTVKDVGRRLRQFALSLE